MLDIEGLSVSVAGTTILRDVNLHVSRGETVALFGPNGSGKTSLLKTIMGIPAFVVESGTLLFKEKDITALDIDERARLGIGMAFQRPPAVRGIKLRELLHICIEKSGRAGEEEIDSYLKALKLDDFRERDINLGYSGGEIKRSELVQLLTQAPDLCLFDEPDSGVDLVSIHLVATVINELLEKDRKKNMRTKGGLIISHAGHILDYVNADRAYVMLNGTLYCSGNPREILEDIREKGYEGCALCPR